MCNVDFVSTHLYIFILACASLCSTVGKNRREEFPHLGPVCCARSDVSPSRDVCAGRLDQVYLSFWSHVCLQSLEAPLQCRGIALSQLCFQLWNNQCCCLVLFMSWPLMGANSTCQTFQLAGPFLQTSLLVLDLHF